LTLLTDLQRISSQGNSAFSKSFRGDNGLTRWTLGPYIGPAIVSLVLDQ